jgi:SAM-dependent methyltransferase
LFFRITWLALLSLMRRNDKDVMKIYNIFSDLMKITTGGNLLNFGFWDNQVNHPFDAQMKLTSMLGIFGSFQNAKDILDVGSGYSIPAIKWLEEYPDSNIYCIDINYNQIAQGIHNFKKNQILDRQTLKTNSIANLEKRLSHINSTSTFLGVKNDTMDRIVAFESAHHFWPLEQFVREARRILKRLGLLIIAIPVIVNTSKRIRCMDIKDLGILKITWASEHYNIEYVKSLIEYNGFEIDEIRLIGSSVYQPLADYYLNNRTYLRNVILNYYPNLLELIINKSMWRMKRASEKGVIDYALFRCIKHSAVS